MSAYVWGSEQTQYFHNLTPEKVLKAVESFGHKTSGRVMPLNSMENRVYEVEIELDSPSASPSEHFKIVKFYRPGRWSRAQILEEHEFLWDLKSHELAVIAPEKNGGSDTLSENEDGLFFTLFPKQGGRECDEWTDLGLSQMGRLLARLHAIGAAKSANCRIRLDLENYGQKNLDYLLSSDKVPKEYAASYKALVEQILKLSAPLFEGIRYQRVHGDCHHGNVLMRDDKLFLIDFDDMVQGPKVQDLWMIVPGTDPYSLAQRATLLQAYESMNEFDHRELRLIESLRSLRMIHFTTWIAHRYEDESFKRAFPSFGSHQYWEKELFDLREQISRIQDNLDKLHYSY